MDGIRKRPAVGGSLAGVLPALHRASGVLEPVAEDDPKARGQPVDPRRRDHPRRERRPSSEKGRSRPPAEERDSSGRRAADVSRLGRGAAVLRLDMPQTPPLPSSPPDSPDEAKKMVTWRMSTMARCSPYLLASTGSKCAARPRQYWRVSDTTT